MRSHYPPWWLDYAPSSRRPAPIANNVEIGGRINISQLALGSWLYSRILTLGDIVTKHPWQMSVELGESHS